MIVMIGIMIGLLLATVWCSIKYNNYWIMMLGALTGMFFSSTIDLIRQNRQTKELIKSTYDDVKYIRRYSNTFDYLVVVGTNTAIRIRRGYELIELPIKEK